MVNRSPIGSGKVRVTFLLPSSIWADRICLVGDFNGWDPEATPLQLTDRGWSVTLILDADRPYGYAFLMNGSEIVHDWPADAYERNAQGVSHAVLRV